MILVTWLRNYKLWYFASFTQVFWETPRIIVKMMNFWRLFFLSINWLLATLCDTLITIRESHCLLRIIWSFSKPVSDHKCVFRICIWLIIYKIFNYKILQITLIFRAILYILVRQFVKNKKECHNFPRNQANTTKELPGILEK